MARIALFASAALAALAAALPAQAQDAQAGVSAGVVLASVEDDNGRGEGRRGGWRSRDSGGGMQAAPERAWRAEQRAAGGAEQPAQPRGEWRQQRQAPDFAQDAPQRRNAPDGGWRSQRPSDGQRYGRDWSNGGTVSRPAPAWRGATPATPDRGVSEQPGAQRWGERNRTYTDPNRASRSGGYREGYRDGRRVERRDDRVEQREAYRDGYRQGRTADSWRDRRDQNRAYTNGYYSGSRDWSRNAYSSRYSGDYRRWDRNDWRRDRRYDWYGYRSHNRDVYRLGRYYSPYRNWSYSRLSIGFFLQPLFYSQSYWIDDPWQYRLPEAYGPYRWVRYYDDALLVDIYSGEVVDVIHDFFW